jgi:hypothetical protein
VVSFSGAAMKPQKFENVHFEDPVTKLQVVSEMSPKQDGYGDEGVTKVLRRVGKDSVVLWSIPKFIGREIIHLSPDGKTLVLLGDFYFGFLVNQTPDAKVARIFQSGTLLRTVLMSDLFPKGVEALCEAQQVEVFGGGWIDTKKAIPELKIDWNAQHMVFVLLGGTKKDLSFQ